MHVTLSLPELSIAAIIGVRRRLRALARQRAHKYGMPKWDPWATDIEGAAAEMAVAKAMGWYWSDSDAPDYHGDVRDVGVRWTPYESGALIVHPGDPDGMTFVLVVGRAPTYRIAGCLEGFEAKDPKWWREDTGRPAFFVPQQHLRDVIDVSRGLGRAA